MTSDLDFIVLNSTRFKENSLVVHTISDEYGRRSFLVRIGPRTPSSLFLPLNILEARVTENPRSELWRISNVSCLHPLNGIRSDLNKNTMTLFLSEVLYRAVHDGDSEPGLYSWCVEEILALDSLGSGYSNFHLRFLLSLSGAMGFSPDVDGLMPFAGDNIQEIKYLLESSFGDAMLLPLSGKQRNEIARSLLKYLEYHTESKLDVRSLQVLRDLYASQT